MAGVPAIYFPLKNSVGNHQHENAFTKNNKAAWILKEDDIDGYFTKFLSQIIKQPDLLKKFSSNNRRLRNPLAAKKLKKIILSLESKNV